MAIVKTVGAPYTITTTNNSDNITLATTSPQGVVISGNLTVLGNTTQVNSANTSITDNFLTLNAGETGPGVSTLGTTAGIIIDRGSRANVKLQWREGANVWQVSDSTGSNFANIITSATSGIANVQADPTPTLGANLQVAGFNIIFNNANAVPPTLVNNATVVYGSNPGGGLAGVYVVNGQAAGQELITKARAFGLSLLL
jgi:hypothetical protein